VFGLEETGNKMKLQQKQCSFHEVNRN